MISMQAEMHTFLMGVEEVCTRRSASAKELRLEALSLAYTQPETPQSSKASSATVQEVLRRRGGSDIPQLNYSDFEQPIKPQPKNIENIVREQRDSDLPPATSRKSKKVLIIFFCLFNG